MKKEEHRAILDELRTAQTDAEKIALLAKLENDYEGMITERDTAVQEKDQAITDRETYRKVNNDLWLKVGGQKETAQQTEVTLPTDEPQVAPKKTYAELADIIESEYKGGNE